MDWRPLSTRNNPEATKQYDVLHEGIPEWLAAPGAKWVNELFSAMSLEGRLDQTLDQVPGMLQRKLPSTRNVGSVVTKLANSVAQGDLDVLDLCVWLTQAFPAGWDHLERLQLLLDLHGSAWTIGTNDSDQPCLERRVDETATTLARAEMDQEGNAALHLHRAWHRAYGKTPDAGGAYREAVRAVEAAVKPVVSPADAAGTLGKMIRAMRDKPVKWTAILDGNGRRSGMEVVIAMCEGLWTSQLDRHGTDDDTVRLDVTQEEAEAAVHLAVTLVHWFQSGAVRSA